MTQQSDTTAQTGNDDIAPLRRRGEVLRHGLKIARIGRFKRRERKESSGRLLGKKD